MAVKGKNQKQYNCETKLETEEILSRDLSQLSPAQRYQFWAKHQAGAELEAFTNSLDFPLDPYQNQAMKHLENGFSVLVAAPTGAGKTLVGEFGIYLSQRQGKRAFYTTPIKALSNQKYRDLLERYGSDAVGLLTGDTAINPQADMVVMTTEVLRNMLYREDGRIENLGYVILDEVHYLADRFRGPVWEEVILHLPSYTQIIALSATVSNAEEFGQWLNQIRSNVEVVVSEHRPVPLQQHLLLGDTLYPLYKKQALNPVLHAKIARISGRGTRAAKAPLPAVVLKELEEKSLLPAIYFIFSRNGCENALKHLLNSSIDLTTISQKRQIEQICWERIEVIPGLDLQVIDWDKTKAALLRGFAVHHAGLLPLVKELVEELFAQGLLGVVFATETLALGINMPARAVVLESLRKFDGADFQFLTPGQYTQLTGRAGRRGIDNQGHGIVLYRPGYEPANIASLASKRTYPLISAFKPSYNMSVNLIDHNGVSLSREVLEKSFAQFQTNKDVVKLAVKAKEKQAEADRLAQRLHCSKGDVFEYIRLHDVLAAQGRVDPAASAHSSLNVDTLLRSLKAGDVVCYQGERKAVWAIVARYYTGQRGERVVVWLRSNGKLEQVSAETLRGDLALCASIHIADYELRRPRDRARLASYLRKQIQAEVFVAPKKRQSVPNLKSKKAIQKLESAIAGKEIEELTSQELDYLLNQHPIRYCPDRKAHIRKASRWIRLEKQAEKLRRKAGNREGNLVATFDKILALLGEMGYVNAQGALEEKGKVLTQIYSEFDLLLAECVSQDIFSGLSPEALSACLSAACYESHHQVVGYVPPPLRPSVEKINCLAQEIRARQHHYGAPVLPDNSTAMVAGIYAWAKGESLARVLASLDMPVGDFVRIVKQLSDVLRQLELVASVEVSALAHQARKQLKRDVVAWSDI